jgi:ribosomal-protein-alanine N-acetyltransferase
LGLHYSWANEEHEYKNLKIKEIGYVLSKDYWGMGLMPEAVSAVIKFCFDKLNLNALTVGHFVENMQSRRVIEKCGFKIYKKSEYYSEQLKKSFQDIKYILIR